MGNSAAKEHCETAKKTGVFKFSQKKLSEFPSILYSIKIYLRILDLSENRLTALPNDIDCFENLKHLKVNKNRLIFLPDALGSLQKLESISACNNEIRSLPQGLSNLSHLKEVHLSGNLLTNFPLVFKDISSIDLLDFSRNKITSIPDEVSSIHAVELILNQNQISSISEEIAKCPRLKTLRLEENCLQLSAIPPQMLGNSNISILTLEGNLFEMKNLAQVEGFEQYMDRYTAMKKKMF